MEWCQGSEFFFAKKPACKFTIIYHPPVLWKTMIVYICMTMEIKKWKLFISFLVLKTSKAEKNSSQPFGPSKKSHFFTPNKPSKIGKAKWGPSWAKQKSSYRVFKQILDLTELSTYVFNGGEGQDYPPLSAKISGFIHPLSKARSRQLSPPCQNLGWTRIAQYSVQNLLGHPVDEV